MFEYARFGHLSCVQNNSAVRQLRVSQVSNNGAMTNDLKIKILSCEVPLV